MSHHDSQTLLTGTTRPHQWHHTRGIHLNVCRDGVNAKVAMVAAVVWVAATTTCGGAPPSGVLAAVPSEERAALVDLYLSTSGPRWWRNRAGWSSYATASDPCDDSWYGVTCEDTPSGSHVMYVLPLCRMVCSVAT